MKPGDLAVPVPIKQYAQTSMPNHSGWWNSNMREALVSKVIIKPTCRGLLMPNFLHCLANMPLGFSCRANQVFYILHLIRFLIDTMALSLTKSQNFKPKIPCYKYLFVKNIKTEVYKT